ncbi:MAG: amino acid adenylation domain-containing protein, partial [bacterium]|nr:amino acid adenylation domain-containing protein [bacterium]
LFDVMFVFQNIDFSEIRIPALNLKPYKHESRKAKFDLTLRSEEAAGKLFLHLGYCIKLFKEESVHRFVSFFKEIVSSLLRQPNQAISRVEIINREEKKQILYDFNRAETEEYPHGITIGELFETQTTKTPNRVAVSAGGTGAGHPELTYSRLNEKANQLARLLRAKGVKPDSVVGLMMDRSPWMLVGIMAIIKAGGAYLPIDPQSPGGRLRFTLSDSRAILLLTTGGLMAKQKTALETAVPGNILAIDDETLYTGDSTNPVKVNEIHNLVYVIYTSGTSGKPKGVMLEHRNLSYLVNGLNREIYRDYAPGFNICFVSPYVFDASVKQIFAALLLGHSLYIVPEEARLDGRALWRYYLENQIHVSDGTPTHLRLLLESIGEEAADIGVSHFIIGGEDLPIGLVKEFLSKFPGRAPEIINIYGPTECTVDTSLFRVTGETVRQLHHGVPIGKPMPNCRVYILDRWDRLQPVGIPGELCISGGGVGRGYLNRLALTGEKFVTDPFNSRDNTAGMYRSGDLARWLPDGNIEFVGRIDQQVKIRGFRVELGETEAQLTRHPQIKEAVVALVEENGDREKELRAYIVPDNELTASVPELKEFLSANLPHYMIPAFFVQIEKIPLTSNGKVDRRRLEAGGKKLGTGVEYIAPESDTEKQVAGIWKEILKLDDVGVHDNFFDLGGNSLKAIRLNNRLNEVLQKEIALVVLFEHVTISSFVRYLERQKDTGEELAQKEARAAQRTQKVKERRGDRRMRRKGEN